mgnify:CR=1 FL=1
MLTDSLYVCPRLKKKLFYNEDYSKLVSSDKEIDYPIFNSIPRFVPKDNYAKGFGEEWKKFGRLQLDFYTGNNLSFNRFEKTTGWRPSDLSGKIVLDAGCGGGRHSEPALSFMPNELYCVDISEAIDVHQASFESIPNNNRIFRSQCSIDTLPFADNSFDVVFCMGVIQHTPDPFKTFSELLRVLKPGGKLVVDTYLKSWRLYTNLQFLFWRPFFKILGHDRGKTLIDLMAPKLFHIHRAIMDVPLLNSIFWRVFPFDSKFPILNLSRSEELDWFIMSIYDGYLSEFIYPQTINSLINWCSKFDLEYCDVFSQKFGDAAPLVLRLIK